MFLTQLKFFLMSAIHCLAGALIVLIPFGLINLLVFHKWGTGTTMGIIFLYYSLSIGLTGAIMLFDLLIIRLLFKLKLEDYIYFIAGVVISIIIIILFVYLYGI